VPCITVALLLPDASLLHHCCLLYHCFIIAIVFFLHMHAMMHLLPHASNGPLVHLLLHLHTGNVAAP
jgi:hypothetical protein